MFVLSIFLSILGISATQDEFHIIQSDAENCESCDEMDTILRTSGYAYYGQIYDDFGNIDYNYKPEENDLNNEIEELIYKYIDKASTAPYLECIPIISQHTNCNEDNIHTGCEECSCDVFGRWNCSVQSCRNVDGLLNLDMKKLTAVMENLGEYKKSTLNERFKRSANDIHYDNNKISFEDLLKWIYGVDSFEATSIKNIRERSRNTVRSIKINNDSSLHLTTTNPETDLLVFDDLLTNIKRDGNDHINKHRSHSESLFYNNNDPFSFDILNEIDNYYVSEANNLKMSTNGTANVTNETATEASTYTYPIENTNLIFDERKGNNRTLKKRDTSVSNETATSVDYNNTINEVEELQKNIFTSLNKILNDKQNELEKLTNIKAKLMLYLKSFGNISISNIISKNVTNNSKEEEYSNIYLYQFEVNPQENLRKHDPNILEKYLRKLKKDIYEVVRDIAGIQRLNSSIPTNLKVLIRAMKYYINKENSGKRLSHSKHKNTFRRGFDVKYRDVENDQPLDIIINMLDVVYNYASTDDILKSLSHDAKKILYRIIKTFYTNEISASNPKIYDLKYNVLSNLKYIGSKWQNLSLNTSLISTQERLPILKYLYTQLSKDICKLNDILQSLQFANSRRMSPVDEVVGKKVVFQIANDLNQINNLINKIIKMKPKQNLKNKELESKMFKLKDNATGIKKSLFEKIKKLLNSSKKEIRNLFHRKVPKTEIVKHIANRKMNEINRKKMSEHEEIMQRWQNNMNIMSTRSKRSAGEYEKIMNKIKHIIPKYLRGKVKPAIDNKKRSKTKLRVTTRKTTRKSKNRRHSKNKSVPTTPKIKSLKNLRQNHTKHGNQQSYGY